MQTASHGTPRRAAAVLAALSLTAFGPALTAAPASAQDGTQPYFSVSPVEPPDHMWGEEWQPGSSVQVDIDDPAVPGDVDFTTTLPTDDNGRFEAFDLPFDIQPGQHVTVTQGDYLKTHDVIDLTIDDVDLAADTVSGTGAAETTTVVNTGTSDVTISVQVTSDTNGAWTADLSADIDLVPGMGFYVFQVDEDGDHTQVDLNPPFPQPSMSVCVNCESVEGFDWPAGVPVTLTIDDPATPTQPDYSAVETVGTDPAGSAGNVGFVFQGAFDVQAGHLVTLDDGLTQITHVVQTVEVTAVDAAADTVSGTAEPGDEIRVYTNPEHGDLAVMVTAQADGTWLADFASVLDLVPGIAGGAEEGDPDPDVPAGTTFTWYIPEDEGYTFTGFSEPIDNDAVNLATAGRTVPMKFRVTTSGGEPVTDIDHVSVTVTDLQCELGTTADQVEEYAAGNSGLQNLGDGYYQYNWRTPKSYKDSCKLLTLDLGDDVPHTAEFHFVR